MTQAQLSDRHHTAKVIGVSVSAAIGGFLFGFDSAVINGAVDAIQGHFNLGSFGLGISVAITLLGCAAGAWFAGRIADRLGRKKVMLIGSALFMVSAIGSGLAVTVYDLMAWRVIGGIGIGIASVIAPTYIAEIAPARYRGALASIQQLALTIGIFTALLSNALLADFASGAANELWLGLEAWRWMFLVEFIPAFVYGVLALLIPESPRYLVEQHRDDEAAEILLHYTGDHDPRERVREIRHTLHHETPTSFSDIRGPVFGLNHLVWVGIGLAALQQLVGINAIFYYSTTLWRSVGFTESQSFTTSVITSVINVTMTFVAILFVDRFGRRNLLMIGSAGMFVSLLATAIAFSQATGSGDNVELANPWGAIALGGANLFVVFFAATWGPIMWVLLAEMFPNDMRTVAMGTAAMANWLTNFVVTLFVPVMTQSVGLWILYGLFAFFALVSLFFVRAKVPETTGLELEEMRT
ncbi:MFS transporter [Rhodococcus sp. WMMA185]|uniref:sugar porter family MFS transporter n=1 Tax=Rhodococcus sp. WMMA185 TaxID=679318 RepID=UPI000878A2CA|nr:sugar porter family MFS transporter [Rhodococcus sp. WMMA185]AOW92480.1 MFS transporter [Rhodococcus sp. WMMA185]